MKEQDSDAENITSRPVVPTTPAVEILKEHTLGEDETLSHLSLKYYGSAAREMWMIIYEANKDIIGPDPAHIRPGTVLKIPKLPK